MNMCSQRHVQCTSSLDSLTASTVGMVAGPLVEDLPSEVWLAAIKRASHGDLRQGELSISPCASSLSRT